MTQTQFDLTGKVALITGAARGIGLGIAKAFAAHGASVAIQDIEHSLAMAEAEKICFAGGKAIGLGGDMTDLSILPGLIEQTVAGLGGLHLLINNAGIQKAESWLAVTPETALHQWTANMLAPLRLSQLVYPRFRDQNFGRIVNVSSIQAQRGNPKMITYSMSKAAMNNLTTALGRDRELTTHNITVNGIAPGWFDTLRNAHAFESEEQKLERARHAVPVGRMGQPEDCAGVALLLCSEAGAYITGETIVVSGGL